MSDRLAEQQRRDEQTRAAAAAAARKDFERADRALEELIKPMIQDASQAAIRRVALLSYPSVGTGKWHFPVADASSPKKDLAMPKTASERLQAAEHRLHMALFNWIRIDKSALREPAVAEVIADRQWLEDKEFFDDLGDAVKAGVGRDRRDQLDLAIMAAALRDIGLRGEELITELQRRMPDDTVTRNLTPDGIRKLLFRHRLNRPPT